MHILYTLVRDGAVVEVSEIICALCMVGIHFIHDQSFTVLGWNGFQLMEVNGLQWMEWNRSCTTHGWNVAHMWMCFVGYIYIYIFAFLQAYEIKRLLNMCGIDLNCSGGDQSCAMCGWEYFSWVWVGLWSWLGSTIYFTWWGLILVVPTVREQLRYMIEVAFTQINQHLWMIGMDLDATPYVSKHSKIFIPVAKVYHSKGRKTDMDRATWETLFITATPDSWEKINTILARPRRIAQGPSQTCKRMASFHYISLWTKLGDDLAIEYTSILLRKIIESDASQYTLWRSLAKYHLWLNHFTSTWCRFA